jgi:hypothetical protein
MKAIRGEKGGETREIETGGIGIAIDGIVAGMIVIEVTTEIEKGIESEIRAVTIMIDGIVAGETKGMRRGMRGRRGMETVIGEGMTGKGAMRGIGETTEIGIGIAREGIEIENRMTDLN